MSVDPPSVGSKGTEHSQTLPAADIPATAVAHLPWAVYLLDCRGGRIYTGVARDVQARWRAHCQGRGARFTRAHPPQQLLASCMYPDQSSALRAEAAIKRMRAAGKRALVAGTLAWPGQPLLPMLQHSEAGQ